MITRAELERLKEVSKKATPGPWLCDFKSPFGIGGAVCSRNSIYTPDWHPQGEVELFRQPHWPSRLGKEPYNNGTYVSVANPELVTRLIEALEVMTETLKEIEAMKDKTQLHDCCVNETCTAIYYENHKVGECAFQYGVNQGYSNSASTAREALAKVYGEE